MEDGTWADTGHGTPQGSVVSPVLANIYLHYVLDLWFHRKWRRTVPEGEALIVRYADDFVLGFQYKRDAERFVRDLRERMASVGLEVHPGKTRLVESGRFAAANYKSTQAGPAGDVRLPGIHALLHDDQARAIPTRAQADVEACQSDPETHQRVCCAGDGMTTSGLLADGWAES